MKDEEYSIHSVRTSHIILTLFIAAITGLTWGVWENSHINNRLDGVVSNNTERIVNFEKRLFDFKENSKNFIIKYGKELEKRTDISRKYSRNSYGETVKQMLKEVGICRQAFKVHSENYYLFREDVNSKVSELNSEIRHLNKRTDNIVAKCCIGAPMSGK
jgi:hypothetical protein